MTELRQKFNRHLTLHRFSPKTNEAYMNAIKSLAAYYRQRVHLTELDTLFASLQSRAFNGEL